MMSTIDQEFQNARQALEYAIASCCKKLSVADGLMCVFMLVHESSREAHREILARGASACGNGFAMAVGARGALVPNTDEDLFALNHIAADEFCCFVSIGDRHAALGIPVENVIGAVCSGDA